MAERIRAHDWAATPLGPIETWPPSLKAVVDLMLSGRQPASIAFGPELTSLYNDGCISILGTRHPDCLGRPYSEVWPEIWAPCQPLIEATMAGEAQHFVDHPAALAGRWFTCSWTPLRDEAGAVMGFYCSATETTGQVLAQAALRESEERLRFSLKGARAAAWQWDFLSQEQVWSPESYELHGRDPRLGTPSYDDWLHCLHPDDRAKIEQIFQDAVAKKLPEYRTEYRVLLPSGEVRRLDALAKIDYAEDGAPLRMSGINLDITERTRAEEALRESEEWLRLALKGSGAAAWQWDILKDEQVWSPESYKLHGRDPKLGPPNYQGWLQCLHPDDRARVDRTVFDAVERRSPEYRTEYRVVLPSGDVRWLDALGNVVYGADGRPLRMSGINLDITERKRAEEALAKAEGFQRQKREELETILAAIPAAVLIASQADCVELTGNPAAHRLLQLPSGTNISKSAPPERAPSNFNIFQNGRPVAPADLPIRKAVAGKRAVSGEELELRFVDGQNKFLLGNALPLFDDAGEVRGAVSAFADITELKRTEAALRDSEERLRIALKGAGAAVWETDISTRRIFWSEDCCELHGRDPKLGSPQYHEWLACLHPDDIAKVEQSNLDAFIGRAVEFKSEYRVLLPAGGIRWLNATGKVDYDADGAPLRVLGLVLDATASKEAEIALQRAELLERQRRQELETILAAIPAAVLIANDASCNVLTGNPAIYDLLGLPPGTNLSKSAPDGQAPSHFEIYQNDHPVPLADLPIRKAVAGKCAVSGQELEFRFVDGRNTFVLGNALPLLDAAGEVCGAVTAYADITDLKRTEVALRESEERLRFALEAAKAGTGEILLETGEFFASERTRSLLDLPPGVPLSPEGALAGFYPEDRVRIMEAFGRTLGTGQPYRVETRVPLPDGSIRWLESQGELRCVSGKRVISGLVQDITERKRAELALRESEALLRSIVEHAPVPILLSREDRKNPSHQSGLDEPHRVHSFRHSDEGRVGGLRLSSIRRPSKGAGQRAFRDRTSKRSQCDVGSHKVG